MGVPSDRRYTKDHEWVLLKGDEAIVGVTDFAQSELGELVFVDLPASGRSVKKGDTFCVVESTKAASDVYAPVDGTVSGVNATLQADPTLINKSPLDQGWIAKLSGVTSADIEKLMTAEQYDNLLAGK